MGMEDWKVSGYVDRNLGQTWVYKENPNFQGIHRSESVDNADRTHVAYNDQSNYYYGVTKTFSGADDQDLVKAWNDYYAM
jgi:hypothetical protein